MTVSFCLSAVESSVLLTMSLRPALHVGTRSHTEYLRTECRINAEMVTSERGVARVRMIKAHSNNVMK